MDSKLKEFIEYTKICLYGKDKDNQDIINDIFLKEIYNSFIDLYKVYLIIEEGMPNNFITDRFRNDDYLLEFNKRYNNFYLILDNIKKRIDNLSKDELDIIRDDTILFNRPAFQRLSFGLFKSKNTAFDRLKTRIEVMSDLKDKELKELIKTELNINWIEEYHNHPNKDKIIYNKFEPINKEIDNIFNELVSNPRSTFVKCVNNRENKNILEFENPVVKIPKLEQFGKRSDNLSFYAEKLEDFREEYSIIKNMTKTLV